MRSPRRSRPRDHAPRSAFIEVEVDSLEQLDRALRCDPDIILVDNLGPEALAEAVRRRDGCAADGARGFRRSLPGYRPGPGTHRCGPDQRRGNHALGSGTRHCTGPRWRRRDSSRRVACPPRIMAGTGARPCLRLRRPGNVEHRSARTTSQCVRTVRFPGRPRR